MKLKATYETEVFVNEPGYITIRQPDSLDPDRAELIMLSPEQALRVADELKRLAHEMEPHWDLVVEEGASGT